MTIEGPVARLQRLIHEQRAVLFSDAIDVQCAGSTHHVRISDEIVEVLSHDVEAEEAMVALGGDVPVCVAVRRTWPGLTLDDLGVALAPVRRQPSTAETRDLRTDAVAGLPAAIVAWKAAQLLCSEFDMASPGVRSRIAQVGLRLLTPPYLATRQRRDVFARSIRWPRFGVGDREWTGDHLDVLATWLTGTDDGSFRVPHLPQRTADRAVVLRCLADQFERGRRYDEGEVRALLRQHCPKSPATQRALLDQQFLQEDHGRFFRPPDNEVVSLR